MFRKTILFFFSSIYCIQAQIVYQHQQIGAGRLGINLTNVGTIGRPDVQSNPTGNPSMEFPVKSGIEHLFEGGIWLGCIMNGQLLVSSSSVEAPKGYITGASGFEFSPTSSVTTISSLTSSPNYSSFAKAHKEIEMNFTDRYTVVPGTSQIIQNHLFPLGADIKLKTYSWNFPYADNYIIFKYTITNHSQNSWDSVFVGMYNDLVVRNINVTQETGTAFFNKGGGGYDTAQNAIYAYQVKGDDIDFTQSYAAVQILGIEFNNYFYHPENNALLKKQGITSIKIIPNFWNYNGTNPPFSRPIDDLERYYKLKNGLTSSDFALPTSPLNSSNNWIQLLSIGPVARIDTGESFDFYVAYMCAKQLGGTKNNQTIDNSQNRALLSQTLNWSKKTFLGEDINSNGLLDSSEDGNKNGKLDRLILPSPPDVPVTKVLVKNQSIDIYWSDNAENTVDKLNNSKDFEGYRIYITRPGDDLNFSVSDSLNLIQQYDKIGNTVGFNNGFLNIKLQNPILFENDTNKYWYHFSIHSLLNGWQYLVALTAFDIGNDSTGLPSLETSVSQNSFRIFPGTEASDLTGWKTGVYPNPYNTSAAWDGIGARDRKIFFYGLPNDATIQIFNSAGDLIRTMVHSSDQDVGQNQSTWFTKYGGESMIFSGGEHVWDLLTEKKSIVSSGTYLFIITDKKTNQQQRGNISIIR